MGLYEIMSGGVQHIHVSVCVIQFLFMNIWLCDLAAECVGQTTQSADCHVI